MADDNSLEYDVEILLPLVDVVREIRRNEQDTLVRTIQKHDDIRKMSVFDHIQQYRHLMNEALDKIYDSEGCNPPLRALGALCGLCVADSIGHNFEFLPIQDCVDTNGPYFEYPSNIAGGVFHKPHNQFMLQPGQWTDDASMSLCMADSLLSCGQLNGSNMRCWFWNWWNNGVDNAFKYDESRWQSVGLGGNIANSLFDVNRLNKGGCPIPHRFNARSEDAGNGSLMRLAPIAIRYHHNIALARQAAYESSLCTHPGHTAAVACSFLAHVLVRAIHRQPDDTTPQCFIDNCVTEYLELLDTAHTASTDANMEANRLLRRVLQSDELEGSTEVCWNWRSPSLLLERAVRNRGLSYNGYPVSAEYFGSYSLDAVSIALHAVYHTRTFPEVIVKTVNFCGDADTTGAIAGQIAGAFYGVTAIDSTWMTQLRAWDPLREIELRCVCLYVAGSHEEIVYGSTSTMDFNQPCTGYDTSLVCPEKCRAGV